MIKRLITDIDILNEADYISEYNLLRGISAQKIDAIRHAEDRRRSLAGLILLRRGVKELFGVTEYQITYSENGKPELPFCCFSIAHCAQYAVCVLSDRPIGVDIERLRPMPRRKRYPLFTAAETEYINAATGEIAPRFFEIWTKKEAYVKRNGGRLSDAAQVEVVSKQRDCRFSSALEDGYVITICQ